MSDERQQVVVTAALLEQGRHLLLLSALLVAVALLTVSLSGGVLLSLLPAAAALWFGLRVSFDAALLRALSAETPGGLDLDGLDASLRALGLLSAGNAGRSLRPRLLGAVRLLIWQGAATVAQVVLLAVALWR